MSRARSSAAPAGEKHRARARGAPAFRPCNNSANNNNNRAIRSSPPPNPGRSQARQGGDIISSPSGYLQFHPQPCVGSSGCENSRLSGELPLPPGRSRLDSDPQIPILSCWAARGWSRGCAAAGWDSAAFPGWMSIVPVGSQGIAARDDFFFLAEPWRCRSGEGGGDAGLGFLGIKKGMRRKYGLQAQDASGSCV